MPHLVVFSHLRWSFVYQRPQHLLSRLAARMPVIVVEEPVRTEHAARLERSSPAPGVEVLTPHTPVDAPGFHDDQLSVLAPLVADWLRDEGVHDIVAWLYTPMALPLINDLAPRAVVYDCMDELAAFRDAPRQMKQRETALLKRADVVFTGGPSLYEAKREASRNVVCLPSAVDSKHYAAAHALADAPAMAHAEALQGGLARPRLGFFGVIDERLDASLVAALADAEPGWQIVMVGPVVKIDPATLPRRPNVHWLGQQPYAVLPQLVAGWDVALMPFARNESTRFISPTKTLEYMAAGKPVVSTPVHDVVSMFGSVVSIADDAGSFVAACRALLERPADERARHAQAMADCVAGVSWDAAAARVAESLDAVLAARPPVVARSATAANAEAPAPEAATAPKVVTPAPTAAASAAAAAKPAAAAGKSVTA